MTDTYTVRYTASYWEQACAGSIYLAAQGDRGRILATGRTYDEAEALAQLDRATSRNGARGAPPMSAAEQALDESDAA